MVTQQIVYRVPGDGEPCVVCGRPVRPHDWVSSQGREYHVSCMAKRIEELEKRV
jgi:hypothetical protein